MTASVDDNATTRVWYSSPATRDSMLERALPIGNGRLGALVSNEPCHELLFITDATLWDGCGNELLGDDGQHRYEPSSSSFGTLTQLAHVAIDLPSHTDVTDYHRDLDLSRGVVSARYNHAGIFYVREVFASHPDDLIVLRLGGEGAYTGTISLSGTHGETTSAEDGTIFFAAAFGNNLRYSAAVTAHCKSGTITSSGSQLVLSDCVEVTVIIGGCTDYSSDGSAGYRDTSVYPVIKARRTVTTAGPFGDLLETHVADFSSQFSGFHLSLGRSTDAQRALETANRVVRRGDTDEPDPELEALYVQFGRYLLISSSRNGLPPGLQGPWLDGNNPAWMGDYHNDININMNYWIADRCGLSRNFAPLTEYILSQLPAWTAQTQKCFNHPNNRFRNSSDKIGGWAVAYSTNIYGGQGWWWHPSGNAWLCLNLWEHWEYTQDLEYLRRIFPVIHGACEFWETRLIPFTLDDGTEVLVADKDWSAEHGPEDAIGITYAQELVYSLFTQFCSAATILDQETSYATTITGLLRRLHLPGLTRSGRLQEWMSDADDLGEKLHRHLSPLIGLFPGDRLTPEASPTNLIRGATLLLEDRGMENFGWACAWRAVCWARLKNADKAYQLIGTNLRPSVGGSTGTAPNLFDMYNGSKGDGDGLFQIDSNFGTAAAVIEMLLYSRPGAIDLLPAVPTAWQSGRATGIGARGGFVVDMLWHKSKVIEATVRSVGGTTTTVTSGDISQDVKLGRGESVTLQF